jgi:hypothetical protein
LPSRFHGGAAHFVRVLQDAFPNDNIQARWDIVGDANIRSARYAQRGFCVSLLAIGISAVSLLLSIITLIRQK